ncbi:hypothetical protein [Gordonia neofelifaecis]|uniref:Phospholipase A2 n=1 Tax=Gordonia neofelifaecis NRRL B-59395 TaxID=644548 RepID=F1YEX1_9ACTN|nr:hypothetical protein [Gordonia neofelifaecis]EGD56954.1 hypothetical protein SCNU_01210 [Gordonia neofelifaecis NRRL B-59395]
MPKKSTLTSNESDVRHHFRRWSLRLLTGATLAVGVFGLLPISSALATTGRVSAPTHLATPAERVVADLVGEHPSDALGDLPADFAARLGYSPILVDGRPVNPRGDCSSPIPLPDRFTDACRAHDLGYDLLRYADTTGRPAGTWARNALDDRLIADMHATCDDPFCHAAAETARTGLAVNTWRQRSGPPVRETNGDIATSYLARTAETLGLK